MNDKNIIKQFADKKLQEELNIKNKLLADILIYLVKTERIFEMKEQIEFLFGDYSNDGHGQYETRICEIEHDNSVEILTRLQQDEEKLVSEFDVNMFNWLSDYEDNKLTKEIVDKFNELNISYNKFDLTKTGELQIFSVDDFFYIWKQLINLVDKDIKVEIKSMKQFFSKCSGYGIYD